MMRVMSKENQLNRGPLFQEAPCSAKGTAILKPRVASQWFSAVGSSSLLGAESRWFSAVSSSPLGAKNMKSKRGAVARGSQSGRLFGAPFLKEQCKAPGSQIGNLAFDQFSTGNQGLRGRDRVGVRHCSRRHIFGAREGCSFL